MAIVNAGISDLDTLMQFYDNAIAHQKTVSNLVWKGFDREVVIKEIEEGRQWKIMIDSQVACVFMTALNDPDIWDERDKDAAIYIHRICTSPDFRGKGFVKIITDWTLDFARINNLDFVRLDTWQDNARLHDIYLNAGFNYVGTKLIDASGNLPKHYWGVTLGLFEISINPAKVISPLMISSSNPISNEPKISFWFFSTKRQRSGATIHTSGTHLSATCRLVRIPKLKRPSNGPYV